MSKMVPVVSDTCFHGKPSESRRVPISSSLVRNVVVVLLLLANANYESHAKTFPLAWNTSETVGGLVKESHLGRGDFHQDDRNKTEPFVNSEENDFATYAITNDLLLVTVLQQSGLGDSTLLPFLVDKALDDVQVWVAMDQQCDYVLFHPSGEISLASISTPTTKRWTIHRPSPGTWRLQQMGRGRYRVRVRGASVLGLQLSLYHIDTETGIAQLVPTSPTAGHEVRAIVDVLGADRVSRLVNVTLVTSEGSVLASQWPRPAGDPLDPQYSASFTWPTQPVYVRVAGEETDGSQFTRQSPILIHPVLVDLRILHNASDEVRPDRPLLMRYRVMNYGQPDTFVLTATIDNEVFKAVVSPAQIRLGHMGSFVGSISLSVRSYFPSTTGILTVQCWSLQHEMAIQNVTILITSHSDVTDDNPPSCGIVSSSSNCTADPDGAVVSSLCDSRHWTMRVTVDDAVSGIRDVRFVDATDDDHYSIAPYRQGQASSSVGVVFTVSCCRYIVFLATADVAGNKQDCKFFRSQARSQVYPQSTSSALTTSHRHDEKTTTPGVGRTQLANHPGNGHTHSKGSFSTPSPKTKANKTRGEAGFQFSTPDYGSKTSTTRLNGVSERSTRYAASGTSSLLEGGAASRRKGTKKHKKDSSSLKTAAIILGSIGGVAGLAVAAICLLFYLRYRKQRRRLAERISRSSSGEDDPWHRLSVPDLVVQQQHPGERRFNINTPM